MSKFPTMKPLDLKDRAIFDRYFKLSKTGLSACSFINIFIWKDFFDFCWEVIDGNLCIFAEDKIGCFLYLPPLGGKVFSSAVKKSFEIMDFKNLNGNISRIENIEDKDKKAYPKVGLKTLVKSEDYLYLRVDLAGLKGNKYKSKRAAVNYFQKNYQFEYLPFRKSDAPECLRLYKNWQGQREKQYSDRIYIQMLKDNFKAQKTAMGHLKELGLMGRVIKIKNKIKAYTLGFKLNKDTFCILFEVADLKIKGIANFLFRKFCEELKGFTYINCMDDSGLENLKKVKLSFRPCKIIPAYIATRN